MAIRFTLNGGAVEFAGDPAMPLLWYLRDHARLPGTKYGCGIGACGACTVHVDDRAQRSCVVTMAALAGKKVRTIEMTAIPILGMQDLLDAWIEADAPQCGWCQPGQLMAAADLLARTSSPTDEEIDSITNLCRCGTYPRLRAAIRAAASRAKR